MSTTLTGPATLCASSILDASEPSAPYSHGVEGVTEDEPHDDPEDHHAPSGGDVEGVDGRVATTAPRRGDGDLAEPEQSDPCHLAGEKLACRHAGQQHLDHATGLLLHHAGQHEVPVGGDGEKEKDGHDERGRLVVGAAARHRSELDVLDRDGRDQGEQIVGTDPGRGRPLAHGDQLDRAGDHALQSFVGLAPPLQPLGVDDEHVDVAVPHRRLAGRRRCRSGGRVLVRRALPWSSMARGRPVGMAPARPTSFVRPPLSSVAGTTIAPTTTMSISTNETRNARRAAALPHLPGRDQPDLPSAAHAATAWRNSSDNVGG